MRINTGFHKGKKIHLPRGIRPTQDKVRKAIFDILGDVSGLSFLELFAGSGAVGFEAASRGVSELELVEYNRDCQLAIKRNIESLKPKACALYPFEAQKAIQVFHRDGRKFDIIFLDPPYHEGLAKKTLHMLGVYDILSPDGLLVAQHFKRDELPADEGSLRRIKQAKYGDTVLSIYNKNVPESNLSRDL